MPDEIGPVDTPRACLPTKFPEQVVRIQVTVADDADIRLVVAVTDAIREMGVREIEMNGGTPEETIDYLSKRADEPVNPVKRRKPGPSQDQTLIDGINP